MFFKKEKEKKMNVPDLWNFMTSLNKKDKALFEELLDNDNEPLEYKGDVKQGGLLKNKKMIERRVIEKEEDGVWNVSGPRLERVFDINKLNTEEDFYLFANKMRYLGIDTALREAGCQDGDTVRLLGFEFEFIEN